MQDAAKNPAPAGQRPARVSLEGSAWRAAVGELLTAARAAWPEVQLDDELFRAHLASHLPADAEVTIVDELHGSDLYLACAATHGVPAAIAALEQHFVRDIDLFVGRMRLPAHLVDETKQVVRTKILIGSLADGAEVAEQRPRIAEYSGRGELRSWMRAAATRSALNLLRSRRVEVLPNDEALLDQPAVGDDPETAALRNRYAADFKAAFLESFGLLTTRQRSLLRHHFLDGLSTEAIGKIYRVHRVTVLRWLGEARDQLSTLTQKKLMQRLGLRRSEFDSVVRLVRSQLNLSLNRELMQSVA